MTELCSVPFTLEGGSVRNSSRTQPGSQVCLSRLSREPAEAAWNVKVHAPALRLRVCLRPARRWLCACLNELKGRYQICRDCAGKVPRKPHPRNPQS